MIKKVSPIETKYSLEFIGTACANYRKMLNIQRSKVAEDLTYTEQMIYKFETGQANNLRIFLYYIDLGLEIDELEDFYNRNYYWNKSIGEYLEVPHE